MNRIQKQQVVTRVEPQVRARPLHHCDSACLTTWLPEQLEAPPVEVLHGRRELPRTVAEAHVAALLFGAGAGEQTTPEADGGNLVAQTIAYREVGGTRPFP